MCGLELARFVLLVLSMLYPNNTLKGFAKAMKTSSCKAKVSIFLSSKIFSTISLDPSLRMHGDIGGSSSEAV